MTSGKPTQKAFSMVQQEKSVRLRRIASQRVIKKRYVKNSTLKKKPKIYKD